MRMRTSTAAGGGHGAPLPLLSTLFLLLTTYIPAARAQDGCIQQGTPYSCSSTSLAQTTGQTGLQCCAGLTCQPFIGCYPSPRQIGHPCLLVPTGQTCSGDKCCGEGLKCVPSQFSLVPNTGACECASSDPNECKKSLGGYNVVIVPAPTPGADQQQEVKEIPVSPTPKPPTNAPPTLAPPTPRPPTPVPPTPRPPTFAPPTQKPTDSISEVCADQVCLDPTNYCEARQISLMDCRAVYDVCGCADSQEVVVSQAPTRKPTDKPTNKPTMKPTKAPVQPPTRSPTTKAPPVAPPTFSSVMDAEEVKQETTPTTTAEVCQSESASAQQCRQSHGCTLSIGSCPFGGACDLNFYCCLLEQCPECQSEMAAEVNCELLSNVLSRGCAPFLPSLDCASDTEVPTSGGTASPTFFPTTDGDETSGATREASGGAPVALVGSAGFVWVTTGVAIAAHGLLR